MATTTNYSWATPDDTDLVKDGAAAIRTLGSSVDTTVKALSPGTTAGDLDYYTSGTAKARVGIGTAGQVLRVNSGATAPEWGSIGGGMTLINTGGTTLSGATTTISSIPATYKNLQLVIRNAGVPSASNISYRINNNSTANRYAQVVYGDSNDSPFNLAKLPLAYQLNAVNEHHLIVVNFYDYANTTTIKTMEQYAAAIDESSTSNLFIRRFFSVFKPVGAITEINLIADTPDFTGGTAFLYGVS
jgi:hypothetical protein